MDHTVSKKSIQNDRGRILANCSSVDLANLQENLNFTNAKLNRSMQDMEIPEYIEKHPELPDSEKRQMMNRYKKAKKAIDTRIATAYYTSPAFAGDLTLAAGNVGLRMRAVVKILATGASVVAGALVSEALEATPIGQIPVLGDIVQTFCGAFVTGILSCTFLYFLDRSELMNRLFKCLDNLHTIETEISYYRQQAEYFEKYAAELMSIDLPQFQAEVKLYSRVANDLETVRSEHELNSVLLKAYERISVFRYGKRGCHHKNWLWIWKKRGRNCRHIYV